MTKPSDSSRYSGYDPREIVGLVEESDRLAPKRFSQLRNMTRRFPDWSEEQKKEVLESLDQVKKDNRESELTSLLWQVIRESSVRLSLYREREERSNLIAKAVRGSESFSVALRKLAELDNKLALLSQLVDGSPAAEPAHNRAKTKLRMAEQVEAYILTLKHERRVVRQAFSTRRFGVKRHARGGKPAWGQYGNLDYIHHLRQGFSLSLPLLALLLELAYYAWTGKQKCFDPNSLGKALNRFKKRWKSS